MQKKRENSFENLLKDTRFFLQHHGVESITLSVISSYTGFTKTNLYNYFDNKESLLAEVYYREIEDFSYGLELKTADIFVPRIFCEILTEEFCDRWNILKLYGYLGINHEKTKSRLTRHLYMENNARLRVLVCAMSVFRYSRTQELEKALLSGYYTLLGLSFDHLKRTDDGDFYKSMDFRSLCSETMMHFLTFP